MKLSQVMCRGCNARCVPGVLRKDQRLVPLRGQLKEPVMDVVEFTGYSRSGIDIADLLQTRDQFQNMMDRHLPAQRPQIDNTVMLGLIVAFSLLWFERDPEFGLQLGRKVIKHIGLPAPKLEFAVTLQQRSVGMQTDVIYVGAVIYKFQDRRQFVDVVLDRRSCQCP